MSEPGGENLCRMIAVFGVQDRQKILLTAFKQLSLTGIVPEGASPGHKDGWGIVVYDRDMPRYLDRKPTDPLTGLDYESAMEGVTRMRPQVIIGHLRKASCGCNSIENTQPFVSSQWSFAHNGTIWSPELRQIGNENDSAAYFRTLLDGLRSSNIEPELAAAVKKIRDRIARHGDNSGRTYSSLTCLLSDGKSIYAVRDVAEDSSCDYYTMYYRVFTKGIVFCQEKIIDGRWEPIQNKTLVAFHPGEDVRIVPCN